MLKDHRDKIGEAEAKQVEEALASTRTTMQAGSVEDINKAVDNLTQASHKLAEAMYKTSSTTTPPTGAPPQDGAGAGPTSEKKKDDVVDAEFVDVDEKK
jgi:molecular chaperone DnaK